MKIFLASILFLISFHAKSQIEFARLLIENNLEFHFPDDFEEIPVKENPDMYYNYAMKLIGEEFEVRYTIMSLKKLLVDFEESKKDSAIMMLNPNDFHKSMVLATILNISQLQMGKDPMPTISAFSTKAVKEEFGCEYGASAFFEVNSTFSEGYKYCTLIVLHKENVADVYITFLSKKKKAMTEFMLKAFYALRFVEE